MSSTPLELDFSFECLKRYLHQHPNKAKELALAHYEDFSVLATEYKQLERDFQTIQTEFIQLQERIIKSPQLPPFL